VRASRGWCARPSPACGSGEGEPSDHSFPRFGGADFFKGPKLVLRVCGVVRRGRGREAIAVVRFDEANTPQCLESPDRVGVDGISDLYDRKSQGVVTTLDTVLQHGRPYLRRRHSRLEGKDDLVEPIERRVRAMIWPHRGSRAVRVVDCLSVLLDDA